MPQHHRTPVRRPAFAAARVLLAVALLAVGQVAVALHAADHPFHPHTSACDAFLGADTQQPSVGPVLIQGTVALRPAPPLPDTHAFIALAVRPAFRARAPPILPTT